MDRYTLIYPSWLECEAATQVARELDVSLVGERTSGEWPGGIEDAFTLGIGLLYGTPRGHRSEAERLAHAEGSLLRTVKAAGESARRRWMAGMIAGHIRATRLNDPGRAESHFIGAGKVVEPGSLEDMASRYALARMYIQSGKPEMARQTLTDLVNTFEAFKATEVFNRASASLAELERKRTR